MYENVLPFCHLRISSSFSSGDFIDFISMKFCALSRSLKTTNTEPLKCFLRSGSLRSSYNLFDTFNTFGNFPKYSKRSSSVVSVFSNPINLQATLNKNLGWQSNFGPLTENFAYQKSGKHYKLVTKVV